MAESVYRIIEIVGSSEVSWEDAAKKAIELASKTRDDLRIAEVIQQDMRIEAGKIVAYRTRLRVSFRFYE